MAEKIDIHDILEKSYTTEVDTFSYFSHFPKDDENFNSLIRKNQFLLSGSFSSMYETTKVDEKNELVDYCKKRILEVRNCHLMARYSHALLALTNNNQYAGQTISAYMKVLDFYSSTYTEKYHIVEYFELLEVVISIYQKYKKKDVYELKDYLKSTLFDNKIAPRVKLFTLAAIKDAIKIFKAHELVNVPSLCIDLFREEVDRNFKKRALEYAISFSKITKDNSSLKIAAELLGDLKWDEIKPYDGHNMAVSHMNETIYEQIIKNYKVAKCATKLEHALNAYEENKKLHKYIRIPLKNSVTNRNKVISQINKLINNKLEESGLNIIASLCFHNLYILLPRYDFIEKETITSLKNFEYTKLMNAVNVDAWGNKSATTHELHTMHQTFHLMFCNLSFDYVLLLIYNAMKKGKIDTSLLKKALETAGFDIPVIFHRNGEQVEISLYSILDRGINEFLAQCENYVEKKDTDWRFCIDFLTPKFESIIRIIANELGIAVTKVLDKGDSQFTTLENILQEQKLKDIFNEDDLFLFKHTFIKEGLNIRNDVAHGLLMPEEYTADKAMLVFLSILRLGKGTMFFLKQQMEKQGIKLD